jgi:F-type H+-transporting ATPase subunit a
MVSEAAAQIAHGLAPAVLGATDPLSHVIDGHLDFGEALHPLTDALYSIGLTKQVFMFLLAGVLTLLFFWSYARKAGQQRVPSRWGNFVESLITFLRDQMTRPFMGEHGDRYVPVIASFFVYILICNLLGLIPFFDYIGHGGNTATGNICITAGLAICAFCFYHYNGIKEQGSLWTYIKNLFPHVPLPILPVIVVVEIVAHIVRPFALAVRLFANMFAGHTMMAVILGFTTVFTEDFFVPGGAISLVCFLSVTALMFLELLVAVIQAFVFSFLTTVFLAGAVHPEH